MSTALRIAAVTHVLKDLLNNGLIDHDITGTIGGNVEVTSRPHDKIDIKDEKSLLNLYLYQVGYNQGWRNIDQPSFNGAGNRTGNPPLALDLHYMLSAYGAGELHSEILLGYGMQILHETMVLGRAAIRRSLSAPSLLDGGQLPEALKMLSASDLADQAEQIRISPESIGVEDISKLWAAFNAPYRLSVAYRVTVVLIESRKAVSRGLPVQERKIYVAPIEPPRISSIESQAGALAPVVANQKILPGYRLVLNGDNLHGEETSVEIDGVIVDPVLSGLEPDDRQISFLLPEGLAAGAHEVQVLHPVRMGDPAVPHTGTASNAIGFVLSPTITGTQVLNVTGSGSNLRTAEIKLQVDPEVLAGQRVTLLMNKTGTASAYTFQWLSPQSPNPPASHASLSFAASGLQPGNYLVRLRVADAESPLHRAPDGTYDSPLISIP